MNQDAGGVQWTDGFYWATDRFTSEPYARQNRMGDARLNDGGCLVTAGELAQGRYVRLIDSRDSTWRQMP